MKLSKGWAIVFVFGSLALILGLSYGATLPNLPHLTHLPMALVAWGTLMLALATFQMITNSNKQEKRRREEEISKETRRRNESLLNEIIDWAKRVLNWRAENRPVLREMAKTAGEITGMRLIHAHVSEVHDFFTGIIGMKEYITKIGFKFGQNLPETIEKLFSDLEAHIEYLEAWQAKLLTDIATGKVDIVSDSKKADAFAEQFEKSISVVLEKTAQIKAKDIVLDLD